MKIISKYKDFYDYLAQDYNADITYVRKPFFITDNLSNFFKNRSSFNRYSYIPNSDIFIDSILFGIYPYVYEAPLVRIKYKTSTDMNEFYYYFFSPKDIEKIITKEDLIDFCKDKVTKYIRSLSYPFNNNKPLSKYTYITWTKNISKDILSKRILKFENKEVFKYIGAPVFCRWSYVDNVPYNDLKDYKGKEEHKIGNRYWIANCSFEKLGMDILKFWIDDLMNINTYNNIENFLWSIKTEPISVPDNKTKIINHGFDLKTSFRNM